MSKVSVLVTGGAGFIGSHIAKQLLISNYEVVILDDLSGGFRRNIPQGAIFIEGSILDNECIEVLFKKYKFNYVFHLAAYAAEGLSHFIRNYNYTNNIIGSVNLINAAVRHKVERFVFTSSIAVYGSGQTPFSEETVPAPEDPYGIAKYAVELDLQAAHEQFGLDFTIFRPHNVYGIGQNLSDPYRNVIGIFMRQIKNKESLSIFGEGNQTRAFTFIDEISSSIANCLELPETKNEIYNLGSDHNISINELATLLLSITKSDTQLSYFDARNEALHASSNHSKAMAVFELENKHDLTETLRAVWLWAKDLEIKTPKKFKSIEIDEGLPTAWK